MNNQIQEKKEEKNDTRNSNGNDKRVGISFDEIQEFFGNRIRREWLTTQQAAELLGVSENALRIMVYRDQIKAHKFGRRLRFKATDCQALFQWKGA